MPSQRRFQVEDCANRMAKAPKMPGWGCVTDAQAPYDGRDQARRVWRQSLPNPKEKTVSNLNDASASAKSDDVKTLAKKHRISVEDATKIVAQFGADRKACDKAARRIAV